jgi:hypothetical protein
MNKLRITKERVVASASVLLASLALASCGKSESKDYIGSDEIFACPDGYITKSSKPLRHDAVYYQALLGFAVTDLTAKIPIDRRSDSQARNDLKVRVSVDRSANHTAQKILHAASQVYPVYRSALGGEEFDITSDTNKINDNSEIFCTNEAKGREDDGHMRLFFTPQAARAIGAMTAAGVDVRIDELRFPGS